VRGRLTVPAGTGDDQLQDRALSDPQLRQYLEGKQVKKVVVVAGKLVSIVVG
jgi:leucyl-tRNA synthetase